MNLINIGDSKGVQDLNKNMSGGNSPPHSLLVEQDQTGHNEHGQKGTA